MRHPTLLFAGMAYDRPEFIELWKELSADSHVPEVIRIFPVRRPRSPNVTSAGLREQQAAGVYREPRSWAFSATTK